MEKSRMILPKGDSIKESQSFETSHIAYNMFVCTNEENYRSSMDAIAALQLDNWDDDMYREWVAEHAGVAHEDEWKSWLCNLNEDVGHKYDNCDLRHKVNGHVVWTLSGLIELRANVIARKAQIDALDVMAWRKSIFDKLGACADGVSVEVDLAE